MIEKHYSQLAELLDTNDDLIGEISSLRLLPIETLSCVRSEIDICNRNKKLLDAVTRSSISNFNSFVERVSAFQPHLVPFLTGNYGKPGLLDRKKILNFFGSLCLSTLTASFDCIIDVTREWIPVLIWAYVTSRREVIKEKY